MFENNPENPEPLSSNTPEWLSALQPASASSLQASVFYQAGYEAGRRELYASVWRRTSIVAIAASVLTASLSGALLFQLSKQNPQTIALANQSQISKPTDAHEPEREPHLASMPANRDTTFDSSQSTVDSSQSLIPKWFRSQVRQVLPIENARVSLLGTGVELRRLEVELDKIIVLNRTNNSNSPSNPSTEESPQTVPQSLRAMRDNQIKSLTKSLL